MHETAQASVSTLIFGPIWWPLALGACLGGNGTSIGASANVIAAFYRVYLDQVLRPLSK
ncbi:MAG: hypothetical protein HQL01_09560 [Nitrospirae bacterium]|nr:hypothetical protein [Nitrospirota bacterium]